MLAAKKSDTSAVEGMLTPTFISIVPHSTSIVELPLIAMTEIWTIRIMEQTVVNAPSENTAMRASFRLLLIFTFASSGIGIAKMTISRVMLAAFPCSGKRASYHRRWKWLPGHRM